MEDSIISTCCAEKSWLFVIAAFFCSCGCTTLSIFGAPSSCMLISQRISENTMFQMCVRLEYFMRDDVAVGTGGEAGYKCSRTRQAAQTAAAVHARAPTLYASTVSTRQNEHAHTHTHAKPHRVSALKCTRTHSTAAQESRVFRRCL